MPAAPKSSMPTRAQERARERRQAAKARKACVLEVWRRAGAQCEWQDEQGVCGRRLEPSGYWWGNVGHVDEIVSRGQGGDPTDPKNCRLVCHRHHFSGPSGAHRVTPNWRQGRV